MKIKYSPCKTDNKETQIEIINDNTLKIDDELFEFDKDSVAWDNIAEQTNYAILEAKRIDRELYLTIRRFYTGSCAGWDTGDYHCIKSDNIDKINDYKNESITLLKGKTKNDIDKEQKKKNTENAILELKKYLSDTDYIILKCLETGKNPCAEYAEVATKRNEARTLINKLEKELEVLS